MLHQIPGLGLERELELDRPRKERPGAWGARPVWGAAGTRPWLPWRRAGRLQEQASEGRAWSRGVLYSHFEDLDLALQVLEPRTANHQFYVFARFLYLERRCRAIIVDR